MEKLNKHSQLPLVSVLMPSYNAERYVAEAIESVLDQTFTDWEMVIVDDQSQDQTYEIVKSFAQKDSRIRISRNEKNVGAAQTRNIAMDLCRGKYVALLDSDDVWYPEKLEKQVALAEKENADIVYCSYGIIDENGKKRCHDFIVPERTNYDDFLVKSVISCSTALLSRTVTDNYRFPLGFYHEDLALWLKLLMDNKKAVGSVEVLADYRIHSDSRAANKFSVAKKRWYIYRDYLHMPLGKRICVFARYAMLGFKKYVDFRN